MKKGIHKIEDLVHLSKADLHIHSNYSDGRPTIQQILDYAEASTDLDVIAITDHNTIDGALEAKRLMAEKKYRFQLIIGEEVSSTDGHIVGLFLKEKVPAGLSSRTTLRRIKEQGGITIAAHPFQTTTVRNPHEPMMDGIGLVPLVREKKYIDAVEIVNATPTREDENIQAAFINRTLLFKAETGSSDAHIIEAIGKGYTLFEGKSIEDLKYALKHHQTQAMYDKWTILALIKYLFFFIPKGFRMMLYTLFHGRGTKRPEIVNVPKDLS